MSDVAIFSIGSVIFMFLTWATLVFMYRRFNLIYREDQSSAPGAEIVETGDLEILASPQSATLDRS